MIGKDLRRRQNSNSDPVPPHGCIRGKMAWRCMTASGGFQGFFEREILRGGKCEEPLDPGMDHS